MNCTVSLLLLRRRDSKVSDYPFFVFARQVQKSRNNRVLVLMGITGTIKDSRQLRGRQRQH